MEDVQSTSGTPNVSNANTSTSAKTSTPTHAGNNNSQNLAPSGLAASIHATTSNNQLPPPTNASIQMKTVIQVTQKNTVFIWIDSNWNSGQKSE